MPPAHSVLFLVAAAAEADRDSVLEGMDRMARRAILARQSQQQPLVREAVEAAELRMVVSVLVHPAPAAMAAVAA